MIVFLVKYSYGFLKPNYHLPLWSSKIPHWEQKIKKTDAQENLVSFLSEVYCWNWLEIFKIKKYKRMSPYWKKRNDKLANLPLIPKSIKDLEQISQKNTKYSKTWVLLNLSSFLCTPLIDYSYVFILCSL